MKRTAIYCVVCPFFAGDELNICWAPVCYDLDGACCNYTGNTTKRIGLLVLFLNADHRHGGIEPPTSSRSLPRLAMSPRLNHPAPCRAYSIPPTGVASQGTLTPPPPPPTPHPSFEHLPARCRINFTLVISLVRSGRYDLLTTSLIFHTTNNTIGRPGLNICFWYFISSQP